MATKILVAMAAAAVALPALAADMGPGIAQPGTAQTGIGTVLADGHGMTLYTFDKDGSGMSACSGDCAHNWPPLMAAAGAKAQGDWTVVAREGGGRQWAYKGHPLYTWSKDAKPGDTTGDGFKGVWHAARP